jgi:hypothetical protein
MDYEGSSPWSQDPVLSHLNSRPHFCKINFNINHQTTTRSLKGFPRDIPTKIMTAYSPMRTSTSYTLHPSWFHHRTQRPNGYKYVFEFGKSRVQTSAQRPAILTEDSRGFPLFLQLNARIVPEIRTRPLFHISSNPLLINHPLIRRYIWATDSIYSPQINK